MRWRAGIGTQLMPGIKRTWPDQTIMILLLGHMRAPAGDARGSEKWRVQLWGKAEHPKDRRGVKIHVGAKMFFAIPELLELLANWNPVFLAGAAAQIAPNLTHRRNARISLLINTVAETHDLFFRLQFFRQPAFHAIRCADFL